MSFTLTSVGLQLVRVWLLVLGGGLLYDAGANAWLRAQLARHGRITQATVVGLTEATGENEEGFYLRLRFATAAGRTVLASSQQTYEPLAYRVGQAVALRYVPRDPRVCLTEAERASRFYLLNAAFTVPFFFFFRSLFRRSSSRRPGWSQPGSIPLF